MHIVKLNNILYFNKTKIKTKTTIKIHIILLFKKTLFKINA